MNNKKLHIISNELLQLIGGGEGHIDCKAEIGVSTSRGEFNSYSCEAHIPVSKESNVIVGAKKDTHTGEKSGYIMWQGNFD